MKVEVVYDIKSWLKLNDGEINIVGYDYQTNILTISIYILSATDPAYKHFNVPVTDDIAAHIAKAIDVGVLVGRVIPATIGMFVVEYLKSVNKEYATMAYFYIYAGQRIKRVFPCCESTMTTYSGATVSDQPHKQCATKRDVSIGKSDIFINENSCDINVAILSEFVSRTEGVCSLCATPCVLKPKLLNTLFKTKYAIDMLSVNESVRSFKKLLAEHASDLISYVEENKDLAKAVGYVND